METHRRQADLPYPLAARGARAEGTRIVVGDVEFGGREFVVIAGPCSVESDGQVREVASRVAASGAALSCAVMHATLAAEQAAAGSHGAA